MSAQQGVEATVDAMVAKLRDASAGLNTTIAALNTSDFTDAWPIDPVADPQENITFGNRSELVYPWVCVLPATAVPTGGAGDLTGNLYRTHGVTTVVYVADPTEEGLARKLIRTQRAVFETLILMRRPGVAQNVGGYGLTWERDEYGPTFQDGPGGQFISWVRTAWSVRQEQTI